MTGSIAFVWEGRLGIDAAVQQLRRGDPDALATLMARYQNRIYRYLLRLVRQPADADDLFQQTWLRVAEKIRSFDTSRNFDAWLFTLARNLAFDHLRRTRPRSLDEPVGDSPEDTMVSRLASGDPGPFELLLATERASRLAGALENLPVTYREVLTLRFEEEMKLEEIALVLAAPLSTVKSRLRRSLEQLREMLEADDAGEVRA
ncbi:MAG: sigma-70 family RNA polymerase sigma factor [Candidatus Acidoferrales bacterium]|nr:sigma-70 family RNA polymerase sigma factor [Candidatus Acidoferrales bacterium]